MHTYTLYIYIYICIYTLFGYSRYPTSASPKLPGRTLFPDLSKVIFLKLSKFITFAAAPLVLTPLYVYIYIYMNIYIYRERDIYI